MQKEPKILIADDDGDMRETLKISLEMVGYSVTAVPDGLAAIEHYSNEHYDLLITDVRMPKCSGPELVQHLQKINETAQVIVMTAYPKGADALNLFAEGAVSYMPKPFETKDLIAMVDYLLSRVTKEYYDDRKVAVVSNRTHSFNQYIPNQPTKVHPDDACNYLLDNPAGAVVIGPDIERKSGVDLIRRIHTTYPFTNIIAYNEMLRNETSQGMDINELKELAAAVYARVNRTDRNLAEKINDALDDRVKRIRNSLESKQENNIYIITGPRASGKTMAAKATSLALPGLVARIARHVTRTKRDNETDGDDHYFLDDTEFGRRESEFIVTYEHRGYMVGIKRSLVEQELNGGRDVILIVANPDKVPLVKERVQSTLGKPNIRTVCILAQPELLCMRSRRRDRNPETYQQAMDDFERFRKTAHEFDRSIWTTNISAEELRTRGEENMDVENTVRSLTAIIREGRF